MEDPVGIDPIADGLKDRCEHLPAMTLRVRCLVRAERIELS